MILLPCEQAANPREIGEADGATCRQDLRTPWPASDASARGASGWRWVSGRDGDPGPSQEHVSEHAAPDELELHTRVNPRPDGTKAGAESVACGRTPRWPRRVRDQDRRRTPPPLVPW